MNITKNSNSRTKEVYNNEYTHNANDANDAHDAHNANNANEQVNHANKADGTKDEIIKIIGDKIERNGKLFTIDDLIEDVEYFTQLKINTPWK